MHALLLIPSLLFAGPRAPDAGTLPTLADAEPQVVVRAHLRAFVKEADAVALEAVLQKAAAQLHTRLRRFDACDADDVGQQLARQVALNLQEKHAHRFPLDAERLRRQAIEAEAFKLETFVATGVFPKRYFG